MVAFSMGPTPILITGADGFIGSHLVPYLLSNGYFVEKWDLKDKNDIFDVDFEYAVEHSFVVIHLAALTNVEWSFKHTEELFKTNVLGTAKVVELCQKYNIQLIYPSSAAVYHPELSPYAESKKLAEAIVKKFPKIATILRLFNVYGPGMNKDSGSLMYEFVQGARDGKLIVYGDGEQTRDFIYIDDVISIMLEAIKKNWSGKVIDCGSGQAYSVNYIAGLFAHDYEVKIKYQKPRGEIKWSVADIQMLKHLYKKKLTPLEKGIEKTINYYDTN